MANPMSGDVVRQRVQKVQESPTAQDDQYRAVQQSTAITGGAAILTAVGTKYPATLGGFTHATTGFKVTLGGIPKPSPLAILWLLPSPAGLVPPEWYGLAPNYYLPGGLTRLPSWVPGAEYDRFVADQVQRNRDQRARVLGAQLGVDPTVAFLQDESANRVPIEARQGLQLAGANTALTTLSARLLRRADEIARRLAEEQQTSGVLADLNAVSQLSQQQRAQEQEGSHTYISPTWLADP